MSLIHFSTPSSVIQSCYHITLQHASILAHSCCCCCCVCCFNYHLFFDFLHTQTMFEPRPRLEQSSWPLLLLLLNFTFCCCCCCCCCCCPHCCCCQQNKKNINFQSNNVHSISGIHRFTETQQYQNHCCCHHINTIKIHINQLCYQWHR